jgi:hypothetical protein
MDVSANSKRRAAVEVAAGSPGINAKKIDHCPLIKK